jgi:hypothetical protein
MKKVYTISKKEINRRIVAYTTLIISFLLSLILFSFNYILSYLNIAIPLLITLIILLWGSRILVVRYFKSIINNKIILTHEYIERNENKYLIKDIKQISIKRTSNKYLREIKIVLDNKKEIFINGINEFEEFVKELLDYLPKNTVKTNSREPIDYDRPTFYFFFGILVGFICYEFAKFLIVIDMQQLNIFYYLLTIVTILMGLYFIIYKPIYKRDEKKQQITDYIWGISFILIGISVIFIYLI